MNYSKQQIINMIREQHQQDLDSLIDFLERILPDNSVEADVPPPQEED